MKKYSEPAAVQQTQTHTVSSFGRAARASIALVLFAGCAQSSVADDDGDLADILDPEQVEIENEKTLLDPVATPGPTSASDAGTSRPRADAASVATATAVVDAGTPAQPVANSTDASAANNVISTPVDAGSAPTMTTPSSPTTPATTPSNGNRYQVKNGLLYDGCGEEFVMRGVNHPTMYVDRAGAAFPEIARTGANTVRLFWYGGHGISINELEPAIDKAVANGMLPIIEMHDSTCSWKMGPIVEQWLKPEAVALIKKHEKHLIVNIANEASPPNADEFVKVYKDAIKRMRDAGIRTPFIIDGGRCGRDYDLLLNRGKELLDADVDHNLIFSAHLYDPLTASQYTSMFAKARALQLPFIVGEFANKEPPGCGKNIDYAGLINEAHKAGIGWLAWSWGDNDASKVFNTDCSEFDMTSTFAFDSLAGWGKDVSVGHAASIQKTAKRPYALTHSDMCK